MEKGKKSLEERLEAHPALKKRVESLLDVVEDVSGDFKKADEAERKVIETLKQMGQEALETWAGDQEKIIGDESESKFGSPHEKKNLLADYLRKGRGIGTNFQSVGNKITPFRQLSSR